MRERLSVRSEYSYEYRIFACEHHTCTRQTSYKLAGREKVKRNYQKFEKPDSFRLFTPPNISLFTRNKSILREREKGKKNSRATDQNEKNANTVDGKPQSSIEEREPLKAHPRRIGDRSFIDRSRNRLGEATLERTRDGRRR